MTKISKNIKQFRTENGFTQEELAEKINVSRQTVSSWENGRTQPDIEMLELLSGALGTGIEELIYGRKNKVGLEDNTHSDRKTLYIILSVFGAILAVVGLVIIFVEIWEKLEFFKNIFSVIPLLFGFSLSCFAVLKKKDSLPWVEGCAVIWTAGMVATNALVNLVSNADFGFERLLLADALLTIPIILITKGIFPFAFFLFAVSYAAAIFRTEASFYGEILWSVILIIVFITSVFYTKRKITPKWKEKNFMRLLLVFAGFSYIDGFAVRNVDDISLVVCAVLSFFVCVYAFNEKLNDSLIKKFECAGVAAAGVVCTFLPLSEGFKFTRSDIAAAVISALVMAAGIALNIKSILNDKMKLLIIISSLLQFAVFLSGLYVLCIISAAITAVLIIIKGVSTSSIITANIGMLCAALLITATIISTDDIDLVFRGIIILLMGVALLVTDGILIKKFRSEVAEK